MILGNVIKQNIFVLYALVAVIALLGSANVEAQDNRAQERWINFLNGSRITNETPVNDPQPGTLVSDYYLCPDGTFVHNNVRTIGPLPPPPLMALSVGETPLQPQGRWAIIVLRDGFNNEFPQLQLSSPGAIELFDLAFVNDNEILVEGKPFIREPNNETECGNPGEPFIAESPLQSGLCN